MRLACTPACTGESTSLVNDTGSNDNVPFVESFTVRAVACFHPAGSFTEAAIHVLSDRAPAGYISTWFQLSTSNSADDDAPDENPDTSAGRMKSKLTSRLVAPAGTSQ